VRITKQPPYYVVCCQAGYLKIDDQGNVITAKLVPRDTDYGIKDMQFIANDKFVMVTNNVAVSGTCLTKIYVEDTLGNILSSQAIVFSDFIRLRKIVFAGNGDFIFGGEAARYDTSSLDFYALRTDTSLNFPPIGIKNISEEVPAEFQLFQNFPNPFNNSTVINFSIVEEDKYTLIIYDICGRQVEKILDRRFKPGSYRLTYNAENLSTDVYFYQLKSFKNIKTKKMVLIK
jgi:Secretion system C-terminal sorting domain